MKVIPFPTKVPLPRKVATESLSDFESKLAYLSPNEAVNARMLVVADLLIRTLYMGEIGEGVDEELFLLTFMELALKKSRALKQEA